MFVLDAYVRTEQRRFVGTETVITPYDTMSTSTAEAPMPTTGFMPDGFYVGCLLGRTSDGSRITRVVSEWKPYIFVKMPMSWSSDVLRDVEIGSGGKIHWMPHAKGFDLSPTPTVEVEEDGALESKTGQTPAQRFSRRVYAYLKLSFASSKSLRNARYLFDVGDDGKRCGGHRQHSNLSRWLTNVMSRSYGDAGSDFFIEDALRDPYAFTTANAVTGPVGCGLEQHLLMFVGIAPGEWLDLDTMTRMAEQPPPPPMQLISFDIECKSGAPNDPYPRPFPAAHRPHDAIVQISAVKARFHNSATTIEEIRVFCLGDTAPCTDMPMSSITVKKTDYTVPAPLFECYATESEVISAFGRYMSACDVVLGYNCSGFDWFVLHFNQPRSHSHAHSPPYKSGPTSSTEPTSYGCAATLRRTR